MNNAANLALIAMLLVITAKMVGEGHLVGFIDIAGHTIACLAVYGILIMVFCNPSVDKI